MSEHVHDWQPVPLRCGRYSCSCGADGWRARDGIRVVRSPRERESNITATCRTTRDGGPVPALPSLDQIERRT